MVPKSDATAYPWRDTAIMIVFQDEEAMRDITTILANKHYGDKTKLQGYYNYMNREFMLTVLSLQ